MANIKGACMNLINRTTSRILCLFTTLMLFASTVSYAGQQNKVSSAEYVKSMGRLARLAEALVANICGNTSLPDHDNFIAQTYPGSNLNCKDKPRNSIVVNNISYFFHDGKAIEINVIMNGYKYRIMLGGSYPYTTNIFTVRIDDNVTIGNSTDIVINENTDKDLEFNTATLRYPVKLNLGKKQNYVLSKKETAKVMNIIYKKDYFPKGMGIMDFIDDATLTKEGKAKFLKRASAVFNEMMAPN